ncbi:cytokine receptor common subunit gamma-like protein [Labeo rohita]|uniref:Cytokine receptor common subunit gamma-like protein n=1 Tax=Labeo rohita TaxID=84645 RepID=A0A498NMA5_LABRO|nr:cytokine receptor common subunit gamma-like protein [Labeo rohita]
MSENIRCTESEVLYRTDDNVWLITTSGSRTSFSLPFPLKKRYEFQVRARIESSCGQSMFWSDWSEPVYWGSLKTKNSTAPGLTTGQLVLVYFFALAVVAVFCVFYCYYKSKEAANQGQPDGEEHIELRNEGLHKYLQKESVDLAQATLYKYAVLETLTLMQSSEETAEQLYKETKEICESNNISEILSGPRLKLYPPFNLTVVEKKDSELWLYWSMPTNISCIESHVLYRTDDNAWQITTTGFSTTIFLPFHLKKRYEFQVRARIASGCGQSMFWSDWSEPVYWGSLKTNNSTGKIAKEFTRLTSMDINKFYEGLDSHLHKLLQLFRLKRFEEVQDMTSLMESLDKMHQTKGREQQLCRDCHANSPGEDFIKGMVIGILLVVEDVKEPLPVSYNDVAIVIEEKIVMRHLGDVPNAFVNLMGLLYMLNLDYPKEMKYTFEVIQRLFMGIGSEMCTSRVHSLKNKLLS